MWKLIAWLGRYAHQPADICLNLTLRQLKLLAKYTEEIVKRESSTSTM